MTTLAPGDLERERDLELERDRFLLRTDLEEEVEAEVEGAPGFDLFSSESFPAASLVWVAEPEEDPLDDCCFA